ncbi:MAG: hypothetical protein QOG75_4240 [Mycobacterium sp.]|jgi:hypothetical protein|nr:hypothetical protein [Mycobacterium sp.]
MSTTIHFGSNVTRMLDRADAALVSPGVRPPLSKLAFRVDQSGLGASRSTRTETNHDSYLKTERPVPGAEVGTRVLGAGHRRGAGSDVATVAATGASPKGRKAPLSCARPKGFEPLTF